jgi:hypothetical protein
MMNQITVADTRANLDLAKAFAESKMVPDHFKKSIGDCYIAINLAQRFGMDAWSVMQELYIIQGKPMMSGKMAIAILNHSLADPLRPVYSGAGDDLEITLSGRPEGETGPLSVTMKVKDAKTSNEQWKKNPEQMLMYAASRMWGRRYTPDILLGIVFDDEEITNPGFNGSRPQMTHKPSTPIASPQGRVDVIDEETGEVLDSPVPLPKNPTESWYNWGARLVSCIRGSADVDMVDRWLAANSEALALCEKEAAKVHGNIASAANTFKLQLMNREEAPK